MTISFAIWGRPQPRGSKRALPSKNASIFALMVDSNPKSYEWMSCVRDAAQQAYSGNLIDGPVVLTARFYFKRPKLHYRTSGAIKPQFASCNHAKIPDLSKLLRCLEDGLTGVVWHDDKLVSEYGAGTGKYWTTEAERAEVVIEEIKP